MFTQSAYVSFFFYYILFTCFIICFLCSIFIILFFLKADGVFFRNKHAYFFLFTFLHSHFLFLKYALLILSALEKVDDYEFKVLLDLILFFFGYFEQIGKFS